MPVADRNVFVRALPCRAVFRKRHKRNTVSSSRLVLSDYFHANQPEESIFCHERANSGRRTVVEHPACPAVGRCQKSAIRVDSFADHQSHVHRICGNKVLPVGVRICQGQIWALNDILKRDTAILRNNKAVCKSKNPVFRISERYFENRVCADSLLEPRGSTVVGQKNCTSVTVGVTELLISEVDVSKCRSTRLCVAQIPKLAVLCGRNASVRATYPDVAIAAGNCGCRETEVSRHPALRMTGNGKGEDQE